jgi:uncharacterized membrane protein
MKAPAWLRLHWAADPVAAHRLSSLAWPIGGGWLNRLALGWDVGVGLFLVECVFKLMRARSTDDIRKRAAALDEAGVAVLPLALFARPLASIAVVIGEAVRAAGDKEQAGTAAVLALATVALSWTFVHVMFAFHYAHEFYAPARRPGGARGKGKAQDRGGLIFPGGETEPDYWDFVHFSTDHRRRPADGRYPDFRQAACAASASIHSVTAFLFNTVIVALAVNYGGQPAGSRPAKRRYALTWPH